MFYVEVHHFSVFSKTFFVVLSLKVFDVFLKHLVSTDQVFYKLVSYKTSTEWITEVMSQAAKEAIARWNLTTFSLIKMALHALYF